MQVLTKRYPKNCLLTIMDRYVAVVRNMEQVVMFPSFLRDRQLSEQAAAPSLYNDFTMLKAIQMEVKLGLLPREKQVKMTDGKTNVAENEAAETEEGKEDVLEQLDIEAQFHLHHSSLYHILTHLTLKAEEVTRIYQEITGQAM